MNNQMGELKIQYSDKKVTSFSGMKILKDFMDTTNITPDYSFAFVHG